MLLAALARLPSVMDEPAPVVGVRLIVDVVVAASVWVPDVASSQSIEKVRPPSSLCSRTGLTPLSTSSMRIGPPVAATGVTVAVWPTRLKV